MSKEKESRYSRCIYFVSQALARKVEKLALEAWKPVHLSPSHAYLLMLVIDDPGVQPGTLSRELQLTPSTITRLIEKLEEKRLLIRTNEGKLTNVYPTPRGKEIQPKLKQCLINFSERYSAILGKEDSARLVQHMYRVSDKLNS